MEAIVIYVCTCSHQTMTQLAISHFEGKSKITLFLTNPRSYIWPKTSHQR